MTTIRRAEAGLAGNGGQFTPTARGDVVVDVPPLSRPAPGRELALDPEVGGLATSVETLPPLAGRWTV